MMRKGDREFAKEIGNRIKDARTRAGHSPRQLAELAEIDPRTVSAIEAGKRFPDFVTLNLIARALEIGPGEILDEKT